MSRVTPHISIDSILGEEAVAPGVRARKKALSKFVASSSGHEKMSRNEIQSWVLAANKTSDDFDDDESESISTPTPITTDAAQEWQAFLSLARHRITQTSTRARTEFLKEKMLAVVQHGGECVFYYSRILPA